jgi:hypothetical protein
MRVYVRYSKNVPVRWVSKVSTNNTSTTLYYIIGRGMHACSAASRITPFKTLGNIVSFILISGIHVTIDRQALVAFSAYW